MHGTNGAPLAALDAKQAGGGLHGPRECVSIRGAAKQRERVSGKSGISLQLRAICRMAAGHFSKRILHFQVLRPRQGPIGKALEDAVLGKKVGERSVELMRARRAVDLEGCQVVFISASEKTRLSEVVAALQGRGTLPVGESEEFAGTGGTIQFFLQENRVRLLSIRMQQTARA